MDGLFATPAWRAADHAPALAMLGLAAAAAADARAAIERRFRPGPARSALLTGYAEPVLEGAAGPSAAFPCPVLAPPPGLVPGPGAPDRAAIRRGALAGRAPVLAWLRDEADLFFLQVQGAGRIRLAEGGTLRLGFAAATGHPYVSLGRHLVARGEIPEAEISAQAILAWLRAAPGRMAALDVNPAYVFFRVLDLDPALGPPGTLGRPLTPLRSLATDPAHLPLGQPVWLEAGTPDGPLALLAVAEDTGSAIRGPDRADLFLGTGPEAFARAGRLRAMARLVPLLPREG